MSYSAMLVLACTMASMIYKLNDRHFYVVTSASALGVCECAIFQKRFPWRNITDNLIALRPWKRWLDILCRCGGQFFFGYNFGTTLEAMRVLRQIHTLAPFETIPR